MSSSEELLSIGAVADRTGLAVSAVRFYEEQGLIEAHRTEAGHRKFTRSTIRRISFIRICQQLGYSLTEIDSQLEILPRKRTPTEADWQLLAAKFSTDIDQRIAGLTDLKEKLDGCIGCGCLSLQRCQLYNREDGAASLGSGPRFLLGNSSQDLP